VRLTTKGRYAVTAMLDLAIHHGGGPITLADIAQRQGISLSYLEQLFARLRKRNLVSSVRGPGGGYTLGREASGIFVAQVIADASPTATSAGSGSVWVATKACGAPSVSRTIPGTAPGRTVPSTMLRPYGTRSSVRQLLLWEDDEPVLAKEKS